VEANAGSDGRNAQGGRGLGDAQLVDGRQFEHGALTVGQPRQRAEERPRVRGRVDALVHAGDVVGIEQLASRDTAQGALLTGSAPPLPGDDDARDAEEPRDRAAGRPALPVGGLDRGEEDVGREVGGQVRVVDASRDEPLHVLDVAAVEHRERLGVVGDTAGIV
jgi:hypothetical protein